MKVGFIGFGEVASTLSKGLIDNGVEVYTSLEGRSIKTCSLAKEMCINICKDYKEVAVISDIIISAVVPAKAVEVAREIGEYSNAVYVDINNVSPKTVKKALSYIKNHKTVDAAIIGSIKRNGIKVQIITSGKSATQFAKLKDYGMNIKIIGSEIGQASTLKMLRSSYTKGISALLFESLYTAYKMDLDNEFLKCLELTECPGFRESAISRIISSGFHADRRAQEMEEVLEMMSDYDNPFISRATAEFFKTLSKKLDKIDKKFEDYKNLFEKISD
jgi:3-hydroxyisobutyrate dehydrogenase-like beta-hydroxyacid dehydrogenase